MSRASGSGIGMQKGFTLIELMIVVVIVGVLAAVAGVSYRKYSNRSRNVEALAMMGEFRAKEEAYRTEFNAYLSTAAAETNLWPVIGSCLAGQVEPCPKAVAGAPAAWTTLGIKPQKTQLYCGYVVIAGATGAAASGKGAALLGVAAQPAPWYYIRAECDNSASVAGATEFLTAMNTTTVTTANENK